MSFHKFNAFTGSIQKATQSQALYPLSPRPLEKMQLPKMMFDSIKTQVARTSKIQKPSYSTATPKIKKLQEEFQADFEKPVFIYRQKDKAIFIFACIMTTLGCLSSLNTIFKLKQKF